MVRIFAVALAAVLTLGGCMSGGSSSGAGLSDVRESFGSGGFTKDADTYGTSRRPDVYGEFTRPTLPTMGAAGYGK